MATPRRLLHRALDGLGNGQITLAEGANATVHGDGQPRVRIEVHRPDFYRRVVIGGTLGAAESYIDGDWDCDDLVGLVRLVAHSQHAQQAVDRKLRIASCIDRWQHHRRRNTRRGSASNIAAHYDLGNDFFRLFLDERMMYSCALYERASASLDAASTAKLDLLCRKLRLGPEDHLLEIGGGWGGLAVYAAKRHRCRVTTATLSPAQHAHTVSLVREHGLEDRVQVLLCDYRDLDGQFDKLVSVEMIEAVGHRFLPDYFRACARLLKPDGLMALQAITIRDQRYRQALRHVDFIKKYIFPGGFIPCISVLVESAARQCDAVLVHLDDLGTDYAHTLRAWRTRFDAQADAITSLGFDERFRRMWRFYFCYCEGGFLERAISDVQMLFAMPAYRGPVRLPAQVAAA